MTLGFPTMFLMISRLNNEVNENVLSLGKGLPDIKNLKYIDILLQGGEVSCSGCWLLSAGSTTVCSAPSGPVWGKPSVWKKYQIMEISIQGRGWGMKN